MIKAAFGLILSVLAPLAAFAADGDPAPPPCTCRAPGARYEVGQIACVLGKLQVCEMVQNVTSWRPVGATCPEAAAPPSSDAAARFHGGGALQAVLVLERR